MELHVRTHAEPGSSCVSEVELTCERAAALEARLHVPWSRQQRSATATAAARPPATAPKDQTWLSVPARYAGPTSLPIELAIDHRSLRSRAHHRDDADLAPGYSAPGSPATRQRARPGLDPDALLVVDRRRPPPKRHWRRSSSHRRAGRTNRIGNRRKPPGKQDAKRALLSATGIPRRRATPTQGESRSYLSVRGDSFTRRVRWLEVPC